MFSRCICLTVLCLCLSISDATAKDAADGLALVPGGLFMEIGELCIAAKEAFKPVDKAELAEAHKELIGSIGVLEKRLAEDGVNGKAWRAYLKLDELKKLLDAEATPNDSALMKIQERFDSDNEGLNLIWFTDVSRALWRYRTIATAISNPMVKEGVDNLLTELPSRLKEYTELPTATRADQLGSVLAWLDTIGQAEKLVEAVYEDYRRPNLFLGASDRLIAEGMSREIDQEEPITDCILGMSISGDGHTTGRIDVELIPNGEEAIIQMTMKGRTVSDNVGSRGVVRVYSDGVTTFEAKKRFIVNAEEIRTEPATCEAVTDSTVKGVRATNGMRLVEKIARKRVYQNLSRGEWIGARHAEERISRRFNEQAKALLAEANASYVNRFRHPLWQRGLFPNELLIASAETGLAATVLQAEANQLAALGVPPQLPAGHDLTLRLHESFVNNLASEALAGRTLNEEQVLAMLKDTMGKIPEHFKAEEGEEPWSITFAAGQPLVLRFDDNGFTIKLAIDGFTRGDSDYPGMDITAHYKIEKTGDGFKAVRQGEVTILPPGFEVGKDTRLSIRQQTLRELIGRRFDKMFRQEIVSEPLELPGKWKKLGKLPLSHWQTVDGWIMTTWKLPERKAGK